MIHRISAVKCKLWACLSPTKAEDRLSDVKGPCWGLSVWPTHRESQAEADTPTSHPPIPLTLCHHPLKFPESMLIGSRLFLDPTPRAQHPNHQLHSHPHSLYCLSVYWVKPASFPPVAYHRDSPKSGNSESCHEIVLTLAEASQYKNSWFKPGHCVLTSHTCLSQKEKQ